MEEKERWLYIATAASLLPLSVPSQLLKSFAGLWVRNGIELEDARKDV